MKLNLLPRARYAAHSRIATRARAAGALACAGLALSVGGGNALAATATSDDTGLAEITVTAEKYNSTIQNTPISMSALSGDQLTAAGITTVADVARDVPGLSMRSAGPGLTEFEARGLASNGGAAPTVGFYLDEVPLSPPALSQSGKVVIDPNLYDVSRVEVLRGPQGTLYGSGSMGGTVKIVTNQPKLDAYEGSFQGTLSDTQGGSGNGSGNFMLNVPFGDMLALRVVGTDTYRSGWIDRVVISPFPQDSGSTRGNVLAAPIQDVVHNVNTENLYGARASVLFQPNSDFSVTASALYQRLVLGGYDNFDSPPGAAYLAHYEAFNIPEPVKDTVHVYSLTAVANLGFADLTSATSYWDRLESQTQDASESASIANGVFPYVNTPFSETDPSQPVQRGNPAHFARRRPPALGGRRLLQQALFDLERVRPECGLRPARQSHRRAVRDRQSLQDRADRAVRRRLVQDHGPMEARGGSALVSLSELPAAAGMGLGHRYGHAGPVESHGGLGQRLQPAHRPVLQPDLRPHDLYFSLQGIPPGRREHHRAAAEHAAAVLHGGRRTLVRPGQRLGLRGRREGAAVRQLADGEQRLLLHQVDRRSADAAARLRL